jgi:hypothetical protein
MVAAFEMNAGNAPGQETIGAVKAFGAAKAVGETGAVAGNATATPAHGGRSIPAGITAPQSFRSNWQQVVAALDDSADGQPRGTAEAGTSQASATNSQEVERWLSGKLPLVETPAQASADTTQLPAQAAAALAGTVVGSEHSASGAAPDAVHSRHAKPVAVDRPVTANSASFMPGPPSPVDAAQGAAQFYQPVQPAMTAKKTGSSASQLPTVFPSNPDAGARPAIAHRGPGGAVSNSVAPMPETETAAPNSADRSLEVPSAVAATSGSHSIVADHSPEMAAESKTAAAYGQLSSQPAASLKSVSGAAPEDSPASTVADNMAVSSLSSASDGGRVRPRTSGFLQSARPEHPGDSLTSPAVAQVIHTQLNGATTGTAVVRDTASALPSGPGQGTPAQTAAGISTTETFTALDSAGGSMHPTWTHAGPHQAEAGFEDPTLGWVSVRAGVNAGMISAVIVPGSADATVALGGHMAGLHDYLWEQHSPVETLTLAAAHSSGTDAGLSQGAQQQQESAEDSRTNAPVHSIATVSRETTATQAAHASKGGSPANLPGSGGRYISVMA